MNRKAYNKVHERYYADPVGFITGSMPNVTIKVSDEHGNATKNPKNVPYNPLERVNSYEPHLVMSIIEYLFAYLVIFISVDI